MVDLFFTEVVDGQAQQRQADELQRLRATVARIESLLPEWERACEGDPHTDINACLAEVKAALSGGPEWDAFAAEQARWAEMRGGTNG